MKEKTLQQRGDTRSDTSDRGILPLSARLTCRRVIRGARASPYLGSLETKVGARDHPVYLARLGRPERTTSSGD